MPDRLREFASDIAPYLPPAFGAFIGLRWAQNQTPTQKVTGFAGGFGLALYMGPAIAEFFNLGPKGTIAVGVLTAVVGMDILGGLMAAAKAFGANPLESFKGWIGAWFNRGGSQ